MQGCVVKRWRFQKKDKVLPTIVTCRCTCSALSRFEKMSMTSERRRPIIGAMFRGPGPAKYLLPGTVGQSVHDPRKHQKPAWSFGLKPTKTEELCSPGPKFLVASNVTRYGKDGTPAYTLHDRTQLQSSFRTPGPGECV